MLIVHNEKSIFVVRAFYDCVFSWFPTLAKMLFSFAKIQNLGKEKAFFAELFC